MHGSRTDHSMVSAKLELDEQINFHKDNGHKVAELSTDLSSAYDTVDHSLLLSKLQHIGIRGRELKFFTSYLEDRQYYTEVQGFVSKLFNMPPASVCQGTKLSSLFYSLFTIDTLEYDKIMQNKDLYKKITGQELRKYKLIRHKILTYVDDTQHVIACENNESLKQYIQDFHILLITMYRNNSLRINEDKTEMLNFDKAEESSNFSITDNYGNVVLNLYL